MSPYAVLVRGARVCVRPSGDADGLGRAPLVTPWLAVGGGLVRIDFGHEDTNTHTFAMTWHLSIVLRVMNGNTYSAARRRGARRAAGRECVRAGRQSRSEQ